MDNFLKGLNAAQLEAVTSSASVLQVLAPPGSGKTKTLTARVAHLVVEQHLQPWNIIVCTFTVKASKEMKDRIKAVVGEKMSKQILLGTFHSVALRYLKHYGHHIGLAKDFTVADSSDTKAILKRIIKRLGLSFEPGQVLGRISAKKAKGSIADRPDNASKTAEQQDFLTLFGEYEAALAESDLLDYDDLLLRCCELLKSHPACVSNIQAVLIDEFQDTNNVQYDLMSLFAQQKNTITIVGDPDQSIYGFRSAEIKNLTRMKVQWPETITVNLEDNYRSSGAILLAAQSVIEQDENRPQKKLQATHKFGFRPVLRKLPSAYAEADWLVSELRRVQIMCGNMLLASDFAILLRSSALSRIIEAALGRAGVPYRMVGGLRFYDRYEVKLIIDYLRVIHNPSNNEAVERIINVPSRKIGAETIKKLQEEARSKGSTLWDLVLGISQGRVQTKIKMNQPAQKGLDTFVNVILTARKRHCGTEQLPPSVVELITTISQKISLQEHLKAKDAGDEKAYEARWANVEELMTQAQDLSAEKMMELVEADRLPVIKNIDQNESGREDFLAMFLANIALASASEQRSETEEEVPQVTISTIHAAKGLEWPVVFVPACYEGSIPHSRAEDNDEERRLLYVAMTRAQALLYLSCPVQNSQHGETTLSSFLSQSGFHTFCEEHGPSLPPNAVVGLSETLHRIVPDAASLAAAKKGLDNDEDNHWPLNGEPPLGSSGEWRAASTDWSAQGEHSINRPVAWTSARSVMNEDAQSLPSAPLVPNSGFRSAKDRYEDIRKEQEEELLRKIDQKAVERKKLIEAPKGKKRQMQGHDTIASFFTKKSKLAVVPADHQPPQRAVENSRQMSPLQDVTNTLLANSSVTSSVLTSAPLLHKPRTAPRPRQIVVNDDVDQKQDDTRYVFLSSSPVRNREFDERPIEPVAPKPAPVAGSQGFQAASTFHTTSMEKVAPQRRTLGINRSLQGWLPKRRP
ncbi:UvrD-helicase-domain-containing protein [Dissoconium aciculare CBS 342.82]|uniref:DNA 3'-5' helicase n=1 Tax=Dissoconium aciculare CBS 342.82 TaxID=1314786 RepID=A0A6J3MJ07_9PEZI|nr:UvrD-helicase-domain-containing protein [Dissoconium aciculare CBS 342.82]KAF1827704.1 UvrD-helicase-domain-containing protein [Dissoconium aciculare CBS 342.82]